MATLNIDIDKAAKKIAKEIHSTESMAYTRAEALKNYHPDLFPVIEDWLDDKEIRFEFQGISLSYIKEKEHLNNYFSTLARMSALLKNPDSIEYYKNRIFRWK